MLRIDRIPARPVLAAVLAGLLVHGAAMAQGGPAQPPAAAAAPAAKPAAPVVDPVVARVDGRDVRQSDVMALAEGLPENVHGAPSAQLYPMLLDQLIDGQALVILARKTGLDKDPAVARQMQDAADRALQSALLSHDVGPSITEQALRARYDHDIAGKPGVEEVHARQILVPTEAEAKKIIADLKKGGDFEATAKKHASGPGGVQGGDLGFFRKDQIVPEFANAAFAMKAGEISQNPVHTQFGWHVIKVEERRTAPPQTFEQAHEALRQRMIQEGVQKVVAQARDGVKVEKFNRDGSTIRPTDGAQPPPATAK
jgi:peptidyl-prolyl cis-trans isomerase C